MILNQPLGSAVNHPTTDKTSLRSCPFCGARVVFFIKDTFRSFGIRCHGCGIELTKPKADCDGIISIWNRRGGTASAAGGRATKGVCSRRKRRACKRNLRRARERQRIERLRQQNLAKISLLRQARAGEFAETAELLANSKAQVAALMARMSPTPGDTYANRG